MRSLSYLRRGLLGVFFVGSLGFGATQALAGPGGPSSNGGWCVLGDPGADAYCNYWCQETLDADGYCLSGGRCSCY
jgi:hypothetical protein